jgi:hypothetical protein
MMSATPSMDAVMLDWLTLAPRSRALLATASVRLSVSSAAMAAEVDSVPEAICCTLSSLTFRALVNASLMAVTVVLVVQLENLISLGTRCQRACCLDTGQGVETAALRSAEARRFRPRCLLGDYSIGVMCAASEFVQDSFDEGTLLLMRLIKLVELKLALAPLMLIGPPAEGLATLTSSVRLPESSRPINCRF